MVMTHLLVNLYPHGQEWCEKYFPDRSLGMLPLGGRLLAEYFIDFGHSCGFDSLLILEKHSTGIWRKSSQNSGMATCLCITEEAETQPCETS